MRRDAHEVPADAVARAVGGHVGRADEGDARGDITFGYVEGAAGGWLATRRRVV